MPDQDLATAWLSFDDARRARLLQKMSPEQKSNLVAAIKQHGASAPAAPSVAPVSTPEEGKGLFATMADNFASNTQPVASAVDTGTFSNALYGREQRAVQNIGSAAARVVGGTPGFFRDLATAGLHSVESGEPSEVMDLMDPLKPLESAADQFQSDAKTDKGLAVENLVGTAAGLGLVGKATHGATEGAKAAPRVIGRKLAEASRDTMRGIIGVGDTQIANKVADIADKANTAHEAHEAKNLKSLKKSTKLMDEHLGQLQKIDLHKRLTDEVATDSAQNRALIEAENQKSTDDYNAKYAAVESKIGDEPLWDVEDLVNEVDGAARDADPSTSPVYKRILRGDETRPVVGPDGQQMYAGDPGFENAFEMRYNRAYQPGITGTGVTFSQLKNWRGLLQKSLQGDITGIQKNAMAGVVKTLTKSMRDLAESRGATNELDAAESAFRQHKETFDDSPNEKSTQTTAHERDTYPEFREDAARNERLDRFAKYNPEIKAQAERIRAKRERIAALGTEKSLQEAAGKPLEKFKEMPPRTEFQRPEVDVRGLTAKMIRATADRWNMTSQYQVRRVVTTLASVGLVLGGHGDLAGTAGAVEIASEVAPKVAANILNRPRVLEFFARPTPQTLRALEDVPHFDKVKIVNILTQEGIDAAREGKPVTLAPSVIAFLGSGNAQKIATAGVVQNPADAKKRLAAVR